MTERGLIERIERRNRHWSTHECHRCGGITDDWTCECMYGARYGPIQEVGHFQIKSPLESNAVSWFKIVDVWSEQQDGELRFRFRYEQWLRSPSAGREQAVDCARRVTEWRLTQLRQAPEPRPVVRKKQKNPKPAGGRFEILRRDNFRCVYCGRGAEDGAKLQVDHVVPSSRGGTDDPGNLRTACKMCNTSKGARVMPDVIKRFAGESRIGKGEGEWNNS